MFLETDLVMSKYDFPCGEDIHDLLLRRKMTVTEICTKTSNQCRHGKVLFIYSNVHHMHYLKR